MHGPVEGAKNASPARSDVSGRIKEDAEDRRSRVISWADTRASPDQVARSPDQVARVTPLLPLGPDTIHAITEK